MAKKIPNPYLGDNKQFREFSDQLKAKGVGFRYAWEARSNPDLKHPNVHCLLFYGEGFQPKVLTALVIDYNVCGTDNHGFGLFMDAPTTSIADDATVIAGR